MDRMCTNEKKKKKPTMVLNSFKIKIVMLDLSSIFPQGLSKRRAGFQGPDGEILAAVFKHSQWQY